MEALEEALGDGSAGSLQERVDYLMDQLLGERLTGHSVKVN